MHLGIIKFRKTVEIAEIPQNCGDNDDALDSVIIPGLISLLLSTNLMGSGWP